MEGHTLHQTVLAGLGDFQAAALQYVVKSYGSCLAAYNGHALGGLGFVLVNGLLGYGINAGVEVGDVDLSRLIGGLGGAVPLAGDGEVDSGYLPILGSFNQLHAAGGGSHIQMGTHAVCALHTGHNILQTGITIGNHLSAFTYRGDVVSRCGNTDGTADGVVCADGERIPGFYKGYAAVGTGEIILGQHSVGIGEGCRVFPILILQVDMPAVHKAGHGMMALQEGNDLVIDRPGPAVGLVLTKVQGINFGIHLLKRTSGIAAAGNKFPHQSLGSKPLFIIIAREIGPVPLAAIEQSQANRFFLFARKGIPGFRGIFSQSIPCPQRNPRLNAIGRFSVYIHPVLVLVCTACDIPVKAGTTVIKYPVAVGIIDAGKGDGAHILRGGKRRGSCPYEHAQAHEHGHKQGQGLSQYFHRVTS